MRLVLLGFDATEAAQLAERIGREETEDGGAPVICLGPGISGAEAAAFLGRSRARDAAARYVVLADGRGTEIFQDFINDDAIFFLSRRPPPLDEVAALLRSALQHDDTRKWRLGVTGGARGAL